MKTALNAQAACHPQPVDRKLIQNYSRAILLTMQRDKEQAIWHRKN